MPPVATRVTGVEEHRPGARLQAPLQFFKSILTVDGRSDMELGQSNSAASITWIGMTSPSRNNLKIDTANNLRFEFGNNLKFDFGDNLKFDRKIT